MAGNVVESSASASRYDMCQVLLRTQLPCLVLQAIAAQPNTAELYAARAQTHIKLENYLDAVDDAKKAIEIDPQLAKGHFRKG